MLPWMSEVLSGVAGAVLIAVIMAVHRAVGRTSKVPKRVDRIESIVPLLMKGQVAQMDILLVLLKCTQGQKCNGDLEEAVDEIKKMREEHVEFLSTHAVSVKANP